MSREADLLHDVNGADFVGGATSAPMPLDGITFGGADRIRGGDGHDSIHAGAGDDLANGDSGGDSVFGDRGNDVMWGGAGRVCAHTDAACLADPGATGEYIDHLAGGKDEDVIDWRPRGAYGTAPTFAGRTCSDRHRPGDHEEGRHDRPVLVVRDDRPLRRRRHRRRRPWPTTSTTRASTGSTAAGTAT